MLSSRRDTALLFLLLATALAVLLGGTDAGGGVRAAPTTVLVEVIGAGTVADTSSGIDCGGGASACYATYSAPSGSVTVRADPDPGWTFQKWDASSTVCQDSTARTCSVPLGADDVRLQADFFTSGPSATHTLAVSCAGGCASTPASVGGDITDSPAPSGARIVECGSGSGGTLNPNGTSCTWEVMAGSTLTVAEKPEPGWLFAGWAGDCGGTGRSCTVQMTADRFVSGTFQQSSTSYTLLANTSGYGAVSGGGVSCANGSSCSAEEAAGSTVTLTEAPAAGYTFTGWSGACTGTHPTCTVQMTADATVTATFALTFTLTVTVTGNGSVSGGSGIGVINCGSTGSTCSGLETANQLVTLTAAPALGATFLGWSGACSGISPTCTVTANTDRSVSASFTGGAASTFTLSVSVSGNGTVSGGGISCGAGGAACTAAEPASSTVTLVATPASGATFNGFGGACSGTTCTVAMTSAQSVTATFSSVPGTYPLTVSVTGNGTVSGGVISCGGGRSPCEASEPAGSTVVLRAAPAPGSTFEGWSGACTGSSPTCRLVLTTALSVGATFGTGHSLTVTVVGAGTVAAPAGACTSSGPAKTCTHTYAGTSAALRASPAAGSRFVGWSGACTGAQPACVVRLTGSRSVTATFSAGPVAGAVLVSAGPPTVVPAPPGYRVTLRFATTLPGAAHVVALRAGRAVTRFAFHVRAGPGTVGPFPVPLPGLYTFQVDLLDGRGLTHTVRWQACLGSCGARAPRSAGTFLVTREQPTVERAGTAWLVKLRFRETQPSAVSLRILRNGGLASELAFAPGAGEVALGPLVLTPGSYTLGLTAVDGYGRVARLTFTLVL